MQWRPPGGFLEAAKAWATTDGMGMFIIGLVAMTRGGAYLFTETPIQSPLEEIAGSSIWSGIVWLTLAAACLYYCWHWKRPAASWTMASAIFVHVVWATSYGAAWIFMNDEYPRAFHSVMVFSSMIALILWGFSRVDRRPPDGPECDKKWGR